MRLKGVAFGVEKTGYGFAKSFVLSEADVQMSLCPLRQGSQPPGSNA